MTSQQLQHFEKTIEKYVKKHLRRGNVLVKGRYFTENYGEYDPIRASIILYYENKMDWLERAFNFVRASLGRKRVDLVPQDLYGKSYPENMTEVLGFKISWKELQSFSHGFDSNGCGYMINDITDPDLFKAGQRLDAKFHPKLV